MSAESSAGTGTTDIAKQQVSGVTQSAGDAAGQVAGTAQDQAREVVSEAKAQVSDLGRQLKGQVGDQATTQRDRAVETLRSLSDELDQMAANSGQSGLATDAARQLAERGRRAAGFLADKQPGDLLAQVTDFARRRSGMFLLGAGAAGLLAGRLTRGATANNASDSAEGYPQGTQDYLAMGEQYPPAGVYGSVPTAGPYVAAAPTPIPDYPYEAAPPQPAVPSGYGAAPTQAYSGQPYPDQSYPDQSYPGQSYPGQPYPGQPAPDQSLPDQSYPAPDLPQESDAGQADPSREGYRP